MSFQDPFAGDLKGFRFDPNAPSAVSAPTPATAAPASRTNTAPAANADFWGAPQTFTFGVGAGGIGGGGRAEAPSAVNVHDALGRLGASASPTAGAAAGAPITGRRAGPTAAAAQPSSFPSAAPAAAASLDWLNEPVVSRAANARAPAQPSGGATASPLADPRARPLPPQQSAVDDDDPLSFLDPDAGRRAVKTAAAATAGAFPGPAAMTSEDDVEARARAARLETAQKLQAAKAAKEAELRDLYASVEALDMELDLLNNKLDTQAIKEEAELTELETTLLIKQQELQAQQAQKDAQVADAHAYGERQVKSMHDRFTEDRVAVLQEVQALEGGRQKRHLQQLQEALKAQEDTVRQLRRQRDLIAQSKPFEAEGIRIAVAMSAAVPVDDDVGVEHDVAVDDDAAEAALDAAPGAADVKTPPPPREHVSPTSAHATAPPTAVGDFDDVFNEFPDLTPAVAASSAGAGKAAAAESTRTPTAAAVASDEASDARGVGREPSSAHTKDDLNARARLVRDAQQRVLRDPTVDEAISAAVQLVQRYVDTHLSAVKEDVVDCVHTETLATAHAARLSNVSAWAEDVLARKAKLSAHVMAMMEAARDRLHDRDAHNATRMGELHAIMQEGRDAVRAQSVQRLEALQTALVARLTHATQAFTAEAEETWKLVEKELRFTLDGDAAMSEAQRSELAQRLGVDRRVRRQLYATQRDDLCAQLASLKRKGQERYQTRMKDLMESTRTLSGRDAIGDSRGHLQNILALVKQQREALTQEVERRANGRDALTEEAPPGDGTAWASSSPSSAENRSHLQELRHRLHTLQYVAREGFERNCEAQQASASARAALMERLKNGVVATLRDRRSAQQSHNTQIEFVRRLWEREHRQCLLAGHHLEVLLDRGRREKDTLETASASVVCETRVHPQEVTLAVLLEALCEKLTTCASRSTTCCQTRASLQANVASRLERVHDHHGEVQLLWATLYEQCLRLHDEQKSLSTQSMAVTEETVRLATEQQVIRGAAQDVERRLTVCHQEGAEVRETYTTTLAEYERYRHELETLADRQLALAEEQNLLQLQGAPIGHSSTRSRCRRHKEVEKNTTPHHSDGETSEEESGLSPEQHTQGQHPSTRRPVSTTGAKRPSDGRFGDGQEQEVGDDVNVCRASLSPDSAQVSPVVVRASPHTRTDRQERSRHHENEEQREEDEAGALPHSTHGNVSLRVRSHTATPLEPYTSTPRSNAPAATAKPTRAPPVTTSATADTKPTTQTHRTPPRSNRRHEGAMPTGSPGRHSSGNTSVSGALQDTSGVSATSLYRTSFMDLLSVLDSTTASF